ncbi:hypothetical protein XELAEV_18004096mg [Xenopus laevis]|uniref:Uncharacterized protein n=1 Tax=Xenopus laevis TaxID=8355 RepID=A0A974H068_XENLA|nr:hypothetical protein XELAEV_18004096mg [Xenopus laevis]
MAEVSVCGSPGTNASVCGGTGIWKCQSVNIHRPSVDTKNRRYIHYSYTYLSSLFLPMYLYITEALRRQHQFIRTYVSQRRQTTPTLISTSVQYLPNSDLPLIWEIVKF